MLLAHEQKAIIEIAANMIRFISLFFVETKLADSIGSLRVLRVNISHIYVDKNSHFSNSVS